MQPSINDLAYKDLRRRILTGEFAPGDWLITHKLSELTGLGRTPVRDAILRLEGEGLVQVSGRFGAHVAELGSTALRELGEVRLALAGKAAMLAALNSTPSDLADIAGEKAKLAGHIKNGPVGNRPSVSFRLRQNEQFRLHLSILTAAHNRLLAERFLRAHWINWVAVGQANSPMPETDLSAFIFLCNDVAGAICRRDGTGAQIAMERLMRESLSLESQAVTHSRNIDQDRSSSLNLLAY